MTRRKGLGTGTGKGYKNMMGKDPMIHSQSAKGMKQPQKIPKICTRCQLDNPNTKLKDIICPENSNFPKIQINEIMSKESFEKLYNTEIEKFKSETVSFTDLGYPDKKVYYVKLKGYDEPFMIKIEGDLTTRELNKFKGLKLKNFE